MSMFWVRHVLILELKKIFSYRVVFWVQFFAGTGCELAVAYFVWKAVYEVTGRSEISGFTFHGLVLYSLFASFSAKISRGTDRGYISQEIYDGGLTRYLLYPLPFFPYKYVTHIAQQIMGTVQLLIATPLLLYVVGDFGGQNLTLGSFVAGVLTCFLVGYLHFLMTSALELVAFWQDVVWNILVMLRFCVGLLGGGMIPLAFFPSWAQRLIQFTPFPLLVSFPTRTFLGQVSLQEWTLSLGLLLGWSMIFTLLVNWIWLRGVKQYSGVGV